MIIFFFYRLPPTLKSFSSTTTWLVVDKNDEKWIQTRVNPLSLKHYFKHLKCLIYCVHMTFRLWNSIFYHGAFSNSCQDFRWKKFGGTQGLKLAPSDPQRRPTIWEGQVQFHWACPSGWVSLLDNYQEGQVIVFRRTSQFFSQLSDKTNGN